MRKPHYTGGVGLCGILGTGHAPHVTIWATSAEYLNDSEELRAGWRFYLGVLGEVSQRIQHEPLNPNNPHAEEGLQSRLSQVGQVQRLLTDALNDEETLDRSPYLSCFSLSKDQLSQWRGYATGGGFAIGFSRHKLESGVSVPESLTPVRYLADQAPAPAGVVEDIAKQFIHRSGAHGAVYASQGIAPSILWRGAEFKHQAFLEEREVRLICHASPEEVKFRAANSGLIPYIQRELPKEAVQEVMIGPGLDVRRQTKALKRFLTQNDLQHVAISCSAAPFRPNPALRGSW